MSFPLSMINTSSAISSICKNVLQRVSRPLHRQRRLLSTQSLEHTNQEVSEGNSELFQSSLQDLHLEEMLKHEDYFQLKNLVTLKDLFQARVHIGHNSGLRHETMSPFIFGERLGRDIIDLDQTLDRLHEALNLCAHIVYRGGMVLFLCRNLQVLPWVEKMARDVAEYSHCRAWKQGIFTNAKNIFETIPLYPDLCVFFNTQDSVFEQHKAVIESSKLLIPSIGFVDTNCDNQDLSHPIPANDDSPACLHLYIDLFRTTVLKAKEKRKLNQILPEGIVSSINTDTPPPSTSSLLSNVSVQK